MKRHPDRPTTCQRPSNASVLREPQEESDNSSESQQPKAFAFSWTRLGWYRKVKLTPKRFHKYASARLANSRLASGNSLSRGVAPSNAHVGENFHMPLEQVQQTLQDEPPQLETKGGVSKPGRLNPQSPSGFSVPPSSWARFPSHTRSERNRPAELVDGVVPRDFAHPMIPRESLESQGSQAPRFACVSRRAAAARIRTLSRKIGRGTKFCLKKITAIRIFSVDTLTRRRNGKEEPRMFESEDETELKGNPSYSGQRAGSYASPGHASRFRDRGGRRSSFVGTAPTTTSSTGATRHNSGSSDEEYLTASSGASHRNSDSSSLQSYARGEHPSRVMPLQGSEFTDLDAETRSNNSDMTVVRNFRFGALGTTSTLRNGASVTRQVACKSAQGLAVGLESTAPIMGGNDEVSRGRNFIRGTDVRGVAGLN